MDLPSFFLAAQYLFSSNLQGARSRDQHVSTILTLPSLGYEPAVYIVTLVMALVISAHHDDEIMLSLASASSLNVYGRGLDTSPASLTTPTQHGAEAISEASCPCVSTGGPRGQHGTAQGPWNTP